MIGVLLTLLALLGVGTAGAENYQLLPEEKGISVVTALTIVQQEEIRWCLYHNKLYKPRADGICYEADEQGHMLRIEVAPNICLSKMEQAMRAIDPWIGYTYNGDTDPDDFKYAKALFYAVRRDCWKETP